MIEVGHRRVRAGHESCAHSAAVHSKASFALKASVLVRLEYPGTGVRDVKSRIDTAPPASLNRRNYRHVNRLFQERERAIEQARIEVVFADRRYKAIKVQHEEKRRHPPLLFRRPKDREAGFDRLQVASPTH
eukprot:1950156-Rhodomonas_salina.2